MEIKTGGVVSTAYLQNQDKLRCSIGIMAYNEAANIARTLDALLAQQTCRCVIDEIIVVASGCTDDTEAIVCSYVARHPHIKLLTQPKREGKASAINLFLGYVSSDILVQVGADTLPTPTAIEQLLEPLEEPEVGMTGGHAIPVNDPHNFMGFAAHLLWELHHQVALKTPKLGELTAFRRIFKRIPVHSPVDEASMEPLIYGQGYLLRYVPEAIVYNRGPETVRDFLTQRRRIYAGHLRLCSKQGYKVSTMSGWHILPAIVRAWQWNWRFILWMPMVIAMEIYSRFLGWVDYRFNKRDHAIWERIATTKEL